ncbi:acyl-CoA carboxylase subunit epsilon [Natronosporangium hydrolyticum]|uniref:Acyl-CoA carboxylase subunit epsilon n=1 Tax=Natronosporangium hydrolyticum TaxID=2811111 RepID=A0A895YBW5_9ACTN|nr:acyl-CoA carboxylase epsilon subunit [Natronosporangium hydrolyticum]QSB15267.1 acyl-CoA carboxylase subunit epsilon [Natronosporangium hydrolyticum]
MGDDQQQLVRVVKGTPTAEELAALAAVLWQRARAAAVTDSPAVSAGSQWVRSSRPGATVGARPADRGAHAWRGSALPR